MEDSIIISEMKVIMTKTVSLAYSSPATKNYMIFSLWKNGTYAFQNKQLFIS